MIFTDLQIIKNYNKLKDSSKNTLASDYITNNLKHVIIIAQKMTHGQNIDAEEIVHDVYISILESEKVGLGYDPARNVGVEQFVFGRINGYQRHARYKGYDTKAGAKDMYPINESYSEDIGLLYKNAPDLCTDLEEVVIAESIETELRTCLEATKQVGINLHQLLHNTQAFANKASAWVLKTKLAPTVLDALRNVLEYPDRRKILTYLDKLETA